MNRSMQIMREVAFQADALYEKAEEFGQRAADAMDDSAGNRQMRGLENIASSALKVADVLDYIKRQTAKAEPNKGWRKGDFGIGLLNFILQELRGRCDGIVAKLDATEMERQRIYLLLIREFIRQLAAHYAFAPMVVGEH